MKTDNSDRFLARWLAGELSHIEQKAFESSKEYHAYMDILRGIDRLENPPFDTEQLFIQQKKYNNTYANPKRTKVKQLSLWLGSVAAIGLVCLGIWWFTASTTTIQTQIGQTRTWTLPDRSEVILNAVSSIAYDEDDFLEHRTLRLTGEALFKVAKGSSFTVQTQNGTVTVLGTIFNIQDRTTQFVVNCYEGKVQVQRDLNEVILTARQGASSNSSSALTVFENQHDYPTWTTNKTSLHDVPLQEVIQALERQYPIHIDATRIDTDRRFTGFFIHQNLERALLSCFKPMQINYTFAEKNTIILSPL